MSNRVSSTISDDTLNRIIQIESAGNPSIKAQTSSATGLGQQLNATWLALVNKYHPEWWNGRTKDGVLNLRKNPSLNIELLARLTEENARIVGTTTGGDLYLAHFLGPVDAKDLFRADPSTPVSKLVSQAVIRANRSIMEGKTAGQVRAWAQRKMSVPPKQDWIGKFYTGKGPDPKRVVPKDEPSPVDDNAKGTPVEQPEPPEPPRRDPVPEVTPAPPEDSEVVIPPEAAGGFFPWLIRVVKSKLAWASSAIGGITFASLMDFITDWRTIVALIALVIVCYLIWRYGRKAS